MDAAPSRPAPAHMPAGGRACSYCNCGPIAQAACSAALLERGAGRKGAVIPAALRTHGAIASIDLQIGGVDEAGILAGQEHNSCCYLGQLCQPAADTEAAPDRFPALPSAVNSCLCHLRAPGPARRDGVDADPSLSQVQRHVLGEDVDGALAGAVGPAIGLHLVRRDAGDIGDAAALSAAVELHAGNAGRRHEARPHHVYRHRPLPVLLCRRQALRDEHCGAVDEVVKPAKFATSLLHDLEAFIPAGNVTLVKADSRCQAERPQLL
mmetsp:Transcript_9263/g.23868  ORF Transcript_9263/g.23868 Transcript_9263/m.23868 type:complete len:266 (-) Transcript_9263:230-1027(-)